MKNRRVSSAEAQLLLCLAGGPEADHAIEEYAARNIDWRRLLELSIRERTHPFVGRRLRELAADRIPSEVMEALRRIERIAEFRQRYLQKRLRDALEILSAAEVPVVLLKGAALGWTTYGSFTDRPMGDVDMLVKPEQAEKAHALLTQAGWVRRFDAELDSLYTQMHHLPPLIDAEARVLGVVLEIHTEVIPPTRNPFNFSASDIWASCQPIRGLPSGVFAPSPLHCLLHCCIHFVWSHLFLQSAWRTFHDIAALCNRGQIEWSELVTAARNARVASCCYWTLRLARATAMVPVPGAVLEGLRPTWPKPVLNLLEHHLRFQLVEAEESCPSLRLHRAMWTAAVQPRLLQQTRSRPWDYDGDRWASVEANKRKDRPVPKPGLISAKAWLNYVKAFIWSR